MVTSTNVVSKAGPGSVLSSTVLSGSACLVSAQAGSLLRIVSLLLETLAADNEVFAAQGSLAHAAALVGDPAFLYKFMFKAKADEAATLKALLQNLRWRLAGTGSDSDSTIKFEGVKSLSKKALEYLHMGIFRFHGQDRQGRPTLLINMSKYNAATGKNSIPQFKECLIFVLEVGRRCIYAVNDALVKANSTMAAIDHSLDSVVAVSKNEDWAVDVGASPRLIHQLSVIVDLDGVGLANVNYEMMPILLGLFKTHYPGIFGTMYVLNFGWLHSGMWSIVKTALSAEACKKLLFLTKAEMSQYFDPHLLLKEHGGIATICHSDAILIKYGKDASLQSPSPHQAKALALIRSKLDIHTVFPNDILPLPPLPPAAATSRSSTRTTQLGRSPRLHATTSPFFSGASEAFFTPRMQPQQTPFASPSMDVWFDAPEDISAFLLSPAMPPAGEESTGAAECWSPGMVLTLGIGAAPGAEALGDLELPESAVEDSGSYTVVEGEGEEESGEDESVTSDAVRTPSSVFGGAIEEGRRGVLRVAQRVAIVHRKRGAVGSRAGAAALVGAEGPCGQCECCSRNRKSESRRIGVVVYGSFKAVVSAPWALSLSLARFVVDNGPFGSKLCQECQAKSLRHHGKGKPQVANISASLSVRVLASVFLVTGTVALLRWYRFLSKSENSFMDYVGSFTALLNRAGLENFGNWLVEHLLG